MNTRRAKEGSAGALNGTTTRPKESNIVDSCGSASTAGIGQEMRVKAITQRCYTNQHIAEMKPPLMRLR
jgi:hypothetical protein